MCPVPVWEEALDAAGDGEEGTAEEARRQVDMDFKPIEGG